MIAFRKGSALVVTMAGIACAGLIAGAGFSLLGGECAKKAVACDAAAAAPVAHVEASECPVTGAAAAQAAAKASSCDYAGKAARSGWTMAHSGAVIVPAALITTASDEACAEAKAACEKAAAECPEIKEACAEKIADCPQANDCAEQMQPAAVVMHVAMVEMHPGEHAEGEEDCCGEAPLQTSPAEIKPINADCPGSGEPITPGLASLHEGFTIGFCCNGCKTKWDPKPAAEKTAYVIEHVSVVNEFCPTCPSMKPSGSNVALFNGFAVGFCNEHCQSKFEAKDAAAKASYIVSVAKPINDVCPDSGKPITVNASAVYRGAVVGFCNAHCRDKFDGAEASAKDATLVRLMTKNFEGVACGDDCAEKCCAEKAGHPAE